MVLKEDEQRFQDLILLLPWDVLSGRIISHKQHPFRLGRHNGKTMMVGSFEVPKGLPWWPDGGAHGPESSPVHPL